MVSRLCVLVAWLVVLAAAAGGSSDGPHAFSLTTFSPDGTLVQLEHAAAAVEQAPPTVGLCGRDCVVLMAVEAEPPATVVAGASALPPVVPLGHRSAAAFAGLAPDARILVGGLIEAAVAHEAEMALPLTAAEAAHHVSETMQVATQRGATRPFGAALLVASCIGGPATPKVSLHHVEPAGWQAPAHATAIGLGAVDLRADLAAKWRPDMPADELTELARDLLEAHLARHRRAGREPWQVRGTLACGVLTAGGWVTFRLPLTAPSSPSNADGNVGRSS